MPLTDEETLNWTKHQHHFVEVIETRDHYYDYIVRYCQFCENNAVRSGITVKLHFTHPKGCKCYWCEWCQCSDLIKRERD